MTKKVHVVAQIRHGFGLDGYIQFVCQTCSWKSAKCEESSDWMMTMLNDAEYKALRHVCGDVTNVTLIIGPSS
jgi:hypothetical protein